MAETTLTRQPLYLVGAAVSALLRPAQHLRPEIEELPGVGLHEAAGRVDSRGTQLDS
jgi:hypothetical protein